MEVYVAFLIASVIVCAGLTCCVRGIATRRGLAFPPQSPRHIHTRAIPRLGGVAIVATFVAVFSFYLFAARHGFGHLPEMDKFQKLVLPALALFAAGLVDDLKGLRARTKLLIQIGGGVCLYFGGMGFTCFRWEAAGPLVSNALCLLATVGWSVLICNAINLIDGLDGLAAGAALFSMVTIFTLALIGERPGVAMATAVLGGALFGFLIFNFNPASIFLGDSGSLFLGFMLSGFVMSESHGQKSMVATVLVPLVAFALPLTDVALSVLRRFLSGHSLFGADREHIHHKLLELGLSQREAVIILYAVSAVCVCFSLLLLMPLRFILIPVVTSFAIFIFFGLRRLGYHEFAEVHRIGRRVARQKQFIAHNIAIRKTAASLRGIRNFAEALQCLEDCLQADFTGFRVTLNAEFSIAAVVQPVDYRFERRFTDRESDDEVVFTLTLTTPSYGTVGELALYRSMEAAVPIDSDLFTRELRRAFSMALENCVSQMTAAVTVTHAAERRLALAANERE